MTTKVKMLRLEGVIVGFRRNIGELESKVVPSTPPEVGEWRKKEVQGAIQNIKDCKVECGRLYEETTHAWASLLDDVVIQDINDKLDAVQNTIESLKGLLKSLSMI